MLGKPSICTISLGRSGAGHTIDHKLHVAANHGFKGIEIFHEDILELSSSMTCGTDKENQLIAATTIGQKCQQLGLTIICLQPFMHYEGLLDRQLHQQRIDEMHHWVELAHNLGTDLILLPSSFLSENQITNDMDLIVSDFQEIADIGLTTSPVVRYAFEALCWGTRVDTWEASWNVVKRVRRSNFGICFDTFNLLGKIYAEPASLTGRTHDCEEILRASIRRMLMQVDVSKIFLVQVADGERLSSPLTPDHEFYNAEQPSRMSWSRNARLFYGEHKYNAYLPVREILHTIVDGLGYKGWLSFEVFNRVLWDEDEKLPETMAQRAMQSWYRMMHDLGTTSENLVAKL